MLGREGSWPRFRFGEAKSNRLSSGCRVTRGDRRKSGRGGERWLNKAIQEGLSISVGRSKRDLQADQKRKRAPARLHTRKSTVAVGRTGGAGTSDSRLSVKPLKRKAQDDENEDRGG